MRYGKKLNGTRSLQGLMAVLLSEVRRSLKSIGVCWLIASISSGVQADSIQALYLDGDSAFFNLIDHTAYLTDPHPPVTDNPADWMNKPTHFQALRHASPSPAPNGDSAWFKIPVLNRGDSRQSYVLDTHLRYADQLAVFIEQNGHFTRLLNESVDKPFSDRYLPQPHCATVFDLDASEAAVLYIGYGSYKNTFLPASIESIDRYRARIQGAQRLDTFLYSTTLAIVVYSLLQLLFVQRLVILSYAAYTLTTLLYFFHMDGYSFKFLWPEYPHWNAFASLPLGVMSIIFFAQFARSFLQTAKKHIVIDRALLAIVCLALTTIPLGLFFTETMKIWSYWLHAPTGILCLCAAILSFRDGMKPALFYLAGMVVLFSTTFTVGLVSDSTGTMTDGMYVQYMLPALLADAILFGAAITWQIRDAQQARDIALNRELAAVNRHKQVMDKLYATEKEKNDALESAREQGRALAAASHDLKQPLLSLKLTIEKLTESEGPSHSLFKKFSRSFSQIEQLATDYLANAETERSMGLLSTTKRGGSGPAHVDRLLSEVVSAFAKQVQALGATIKHRPCTAMTKEEPMLVRALLNNVLEYLVEHKNDIHRIVVGCRRVGDTLKIVIVEDGKSNRPAAEHFANTLANPEGNYRFSIRCGNGATEYSFFLRRYLDEIR